MTKGGLTFGPSLGEYLKHENIAQNTVGRACLMTKNQISKAIHGRHAMTSEDAYEICKYLGVTVEFIMEEEWKTGKRMGDPTIPRKQVPATAYKKGENRFLGRKKT